MYRALLDQERARDGRPDPRYALIDESHRPPLEEQVRERSPLLLRLQAGQPVIIPAWRLGGHSIPTPADVPLFTDRTIPWLKVAADDVVSPSSRTAG
ncbi:hypothetical protein BST47_02575 [Mycolicibacterium tusciae]|uniref:Uncharacterized protein n=1 Tax=Mycolicibacterium tusciae TaxID=75922 RepID=A0A1X0K113_9MYCO|nr:hypothetical protein BST47_02575 [Mycolicibacterium tusciae]